MTDEFDVIVIGAGPAGEVAAGRCADGGLATALVEAELVGGECSYWGCIPSKTMIRPGDALAAVRRVPGAAEAVTGSVNVAAALARRDYMTSDLHDDGQVPWLMDRGIELVRGSGRLAGIRRVIVQTAEGATRDLSATRAVILATGTSALIPPVDGLRDARPWDNRGGTSAKEVPHRLLVLGGGAVGSEMAQAFRRLGSEEVVVVEGGDRLLVREEPFAGEQVGEAFEAEGITLATGVRLQSAHREGTDGPIVAGVDDGREWRVDELLVAVGRRPRTKDLGLEIVGLEPGASVAVDDRLRALGVDGGWLYAVGDCNGRALLTHMGKYQGRIAADVILGRDAAARADHDIVPRVVFTDPQVCAVGLTQAQARERGLDVRAVTAPVDAVPGAHVLGEEITGTGKLVVDQARRMVVGATFTGPGLQELLHSATVAIAARATIDDLWHAVPAFPTVSEIWLHLLEAYERAVPS